MWFNKTLTGKGSDQILTTIADVSAVTKKINADDRLLKFTYSTKLLQCITIPALGRGTDFSLSTKPTQYMLVAKDGSVISVDQASCYH